MATASAGELAEVSDQLLATIRANWPKPLGLLLSFFLAGGIGLSLANALGVGFAAAGALILMAAFLAHWLWNRRIPRCPDGQVGFLVAISVEDDRTYRIFERDFIDNLGRVLRASSQAGRVWVGAVPQVRIPKQPTELEAIELRKVSKTAFVLYGQVRTRGEGTERKHYVDLAGLVGHSQTVKSNQQQLQIEFSELLSRRIIANQGDELPAFELTSSLSSLVAKYIVGIAMFISGQVDAAQAFYEDADRLSKGQSDANEAVKKIRERLPRRFSEVAILQASSQYESWRETREEPYIARAESILDAAPDIAREWPQWKSLKAIAQVVLAKGDIDKIEKLASGGLERDPVTHMNLAFVKILRGDLRAAAQRYRRAADLKVNMDTIDEVMSFVEWYRDLNPASFAELSFALGFISYCHLRDEKLAQKYFQEFANSRDDRYEVESGLTEKWVYELQVK